MNLERVQKYYELIDRELGLESDEDLFGFESEEEDLFGFESEEDDLFGFESGGAKRGYISQMYGKLKEKGIKGISAGQKTGNSVLETAIKNGSLRKQIQYILQMISKHMYDGDIFPYSGVFSKASADAIDATESMLIVTAYMIINNSVKVSECKNASVRLAQLDFDKLKDNRNSFGMSRQIMKVCAPFISIVKNMRKMKSMDKSNVHRIIAQLKSNDIRRITDDMMQIFKCIRLLETKFISVRNIVELPESEIMDMFKLFNDCIRGMKMTCRFIRSKVGE